MKKAKAALLIAGSILATGISGNALADSQPTIGLAVANLEAPFFNFIKRSVVKAADKSGVKVVTVDAQGDPAKQLSQVQDLIGRHVDAIIYIPAGATAASIPVKDARQAHIPIVAVDRNPPNAPADSFVATNSVRAAQKLGQYICQQTNGHGEMGIIQGQLGTTPQVQRSKGMKKALENCSKIKVAARQASKQWHEDEGYNIAQSMLQRDPKMNIVWGQADALALGAAQAEKAAHLSHKVSIYGFDGDPSGLKAVKNGEMAATMCQKSNYMGALAFKTAMKLIHGKTVPKQQLQSAILVTKANAAKYIAHHP